MLSKQKKKIKSSLMNMEQKSISKTFHPTGSNCENCGSELKYFEFEVFGVLKKFPVLCNCKAEELEERKKKEEIEAKKRRLERMFSQVNLGERFRNANFEKFKVTEESREIYKCLKDYAYNFKVNKKKSILLYSKRGTGKTLLVSAVANTVLKNGHIAIFQTMPDLLMKLRSSFTNPNYSEDRLIKGLVDCDLLIIDDLGAEYKKNINYNNSKISDDWSNEKLFQIVNSRYNNLKATIFTTNCSIEDLYNRIGGRIFSRITEMCDGMKFDMNNLPDYRMENYF